MGEMRMEGDGWCTKCKDKDRGPKRVEHVCHNVEVIAIVQKPWKWIIVRISSSCCLVATLAASRQSRECDGAPKHGRKCDDEATKESRLWQATVAARVAKTCAR